ncbi:PI-PLC X domain-containing protein 1 isoform X2 [Mustela lutreola]|uniref:PI-PLC X domain-containing protein 1 isoform X2 n=1 Tax=Mustela lutreola TaxID=9666 RepID=UPI0027974A8D|nr:PI-PLC X domain-containing protein 1 isoform X2 [Mustela lutreola]
MASGKKFMPRSGREEKGREFFLSWLFHNLLQLKVVLMAKRVISGRPGLTPPTPLYRQSSDSGRLGQRKGHMQTTRNSSLADGGTGWTLMGGQVSTSGSFRSLPCTTNADWMSALCPVLWDVPLHQLSIPGSHDTMTYCLNKTSPISQTQSRLLQLLGKVLPCVTRPVVLRWSTTQVLGVTEQLDAGVRYLDLRIAHMRDGSEKNLHFVHMVYTTSLVEDTLTEISEWLESHPREVVILACRDFEGMTDGLHEYLVACIRNIFGDMLCPRGEMPTLNQMWSRGQQVILSYEEDSVVNRHAELWPGIPYWWGDQVKPQELIRYLERMKSCGRPGGLFVAGINLTENLAYVLGHPTESLRKMTLPSLPCLRAWVREQSPGPGAQCTNIIAGDFIGADAFVGDVIRLNEKLLRC